MLVPLDPTHDSIKHFSVLCVDLALSNPVVYGVLDASADIIKRLPRSAEDAVLGEGSRDHEDQSHGGKGRGA